MPVLLYVACAFSQGVLANVHIPTEIITNYKIISGERALALEVIPSSWKQSCQKAAFPDPSLFLILLYNCLLVCGYDNPD